MSTSENFCAIVKNDKILTIKKKKKASAANCIACAAAIDCAYTGLTGLISMLLDLKVFTSIHKVY